MWPLPGPYIYWWFFLYKIAEFFCFPFTFPCNIYSTYIFKLYDSFRGYLLLKIIAAYKYIVQGR